MRARDDAAAGKVIELPVGNASVKRRVLPRTPAGEVRLTHLKAMLERYVLPMYGLDESGYPLEYERLLGEIMSYLDRHVEGQAVVALHTGLVLHLRIQDETGEYTYGVTLDPESFGESE